MQSHAQSKNKMNLGQKLCTTFFFLVPLISCIPCIYEQFFHSYKGLKYIQYFLNNVTNSQVNNLALPFLLLLPYPKPSSAFSMIHSSWESRLFDHIILTFIYRSYLTLTIPMLSVNIHIYRSCIPYALMIY